MVEEAAAELAALPEAEADTLDVLGLQAMILQEQKEWLMLQMLCSSTVRRDPGNPAWWITWAYATRRCETLGAAEHILLDGEAHHPKEATIQFNLGCYACQRGDLATAQKRVARAVDLNPEFRAMAATDPDLAPLRASGFSV